MAYCTLSRLRRLRRGAQLQSWIGAKSPRRRLTYAYDTDMIAVLWMTKIRVHWIRNVTNKRRTATAECTRQHWACGRCRYTSLRLIFIAKQSQRVCTAVSYIAAQVRLRQSDGNPRVLTRVTFDQRSPTQVLARVTCDQRSPTQVLTRVTCDQRSPTEYSPEWLVVNTLKSRLTSPAL